MFLILFIGLLLAWLLGWAAFQVARGSIHLLGILAAVSLMRGRRVPTRTLPAALSGGRWQEVTDERMFKHREGVQF